MKIKEPEFTYNSCSQLVGLKRKLIASIEKEEDVEVLLQYASVMKQKQVVSPKSDEVYFAKLEERVWMSERYFYAVLFHRRRIGCGN